MPLALNKIFGLIVAVGGLTFLSPLAKLQARSPGDLDPTFGNGGKVTTDFLGMYRADAILSMAIQSDGKIVVGGYTHNFTDADFAVMRYDAQGNPDPSFGPGGTNGEGRVRIDFGGNDLIRALVIYKGKIIAAGSSDNRLALVCLKIEDGSLDNSCTSDGKVLIDLAGSSEEAIYALALQPDGKIVFAGSARGEGEGFNFVIGRFKKNSESSSDSTFLDQTFHYPGYHRIDLGEGFDDEARAVAIQPVSGPEEFKILVAGYATTTASNENRHKDFALARFLTNGELDTDWGADGQGFILRDFENGSDDVATALVIERNPPESFVNRIYVAGYIEGSTEKWAFVRYNSTGLEIGYSTSVYTGSTTSRPSAIALYPQQDEHVIIAGTARNDFALEQYQYYDEGYNERTGSFGGGLDENFSGGRVLTDLGGEDEVHAIAIQPDGKIVVAGSTYQRPNTDFALARYIGMSADLSITLSCDTPEITIGNNANFTVTVTNQGPYDFLKEAPLTISLPSTFSSVIASSHGIEGCTSTPPITCRWSSYLLDSGPLTLEVATNPSQVARRLRTTAEVSSVVYDPTLGNNQSNVVVRMLARPRRR